MVTKKKESCLTAKKIDALKNKKKGSVLYCSAVNKVKII
jgi:hypothetical protein